MKKRFSFFVLFFAVFVPAAFAAAAPAEISHPNRDEAARLDEASCADGFSFVVVGDSHASRDVFPALVNAARMMKPDFAVSVGDFTNNGLEEEYRLFVDQISGAGVPWFAVPGNHEYRDPNGHTSPDGQKRFERIFGNSDFAFEHCGWRFVGLDIVAYDMLTPTQLKKLERVLDGGGGRAAVFMHYPPAVIPHWEDGYWKANAPEFMKLLEDSGARFFFAGHIHVFDWVRRGPTTYIVTAGGGGGNDTERTPDLLNAPDAGGFYHFIYVTVNGDEADWFVVRLEEPRSGK